jgi:hypothetical protein
VRPVPLEELERLAGILSKAGKLAESSWRLFRSASGLEQANRVAEMVARERLKARDETGDTWEAGFTLLDE